MCSYSRKTTRRDGQKRSCRTKVTPQAVSAVTLKLFVSCRDLTRQCFYDPRHCEISKIHVCHSPGFCKTPHSNWDLESTNENVQWHEENAYYFEIYFSLFSFLDNQLQWQRLLWTLEGVYSWTCKNLTVKGTVHNKIKNTYPSSYL